MEIRNVGEIIDSTEGTSKNLEDQVLDHNLNGTASSLNGHMDERNRFLYEQLHKNSKKDHEKIETTDKMNKINKDANECNEETKTEDSNLSKHGKEEEPKGYSQQDDDPMPDTLKTDSDIDGSQPVVDQLDHNMDRAKATDDTEPASMANIPDAEVVTEACAGVQSPPNANQDDSDAIQDTVDGSTEKDEVAREDRAIHLENGESFPQDTSTAKQIEEAAKAEDQQSKQPDADADAVKEDISRSEEIGVSEESEHADETVLDAQEERHQETSEDTSGPACGEKEQTYQQSSMAASDDTASEEPKRDGQLDEDTMPVTLTTGIDIDQSQLVVDQLDHNTDPEKTTEDASASMENIPITEVAIEACAGVQSPLNANLDDSDAIQDIVDGNTENDEAARDDGTIHQEHTESFPEDTSTAKYIEGAVKEEDQQSKQADATDADAVREDISRSEEIGVSEEIPKSEHADEAVLDAQEQRHQETSEDTNGPACGEKEQTSQQSSMEPSDDTAPEEPKGDDQQDEDPMPDTLKTGIDIDQSQLAIDQLDHNIDPEKANEDIPPSMENIPSTEVAIEACAGVQTPLDANLDDSDAIQETVDVNTEKDEVARDDGTIHQEHRECFPEDASTAKLIEEVVKAEDQQSKQADATDADAVQEDISRSEEIGVSEETEHVDEAVLDAQEECHQETSEDTSGPAYVEKEQTFQQSSMEASDDTALEEPKGDGQLDDDPTPDTLKTGIDIDQSQLAVDQLDHNTDPEKANEDIPASMENTPNTEVATEACAGVQSPLDANLDGSDAIQETVDVNTENDEAARDDGTIHHEHRESFPEDTSTAKHIEEAVKVEADDQQSKQADATDADAVNEDISRCEEIGVSEEIPKSEHAGEPVLDAQEECHQETSEDINGPAYGEKEQTSQQRSMEASDDRASEDPKGDDQLDEDPVPDTLKTGIDIDQNQLVIDQLNHNMDPEEVTEDISASMENIHNTEAATEACAGLQSPLNANLEDSDAIQDTLDGNREKDEIARGDGTIHHEHRKEVVKVEDQQSKQADDTDADMVPEVITTCEETGMSEEISESEHADEPIIDPQEELPQETSEDTNGPACGEKVQTSQHSSMSASDDTVSEHDSTNWAPPVDIQVQNNESLEEMKDAEAVDTEEAMQQSCVPECHVPTTGQHLVGINSTESAESHNVKTVPGSDEDKVENIETGPTSTNQELESGGVSNIEDTEEQAAPHHDHPEEKATEETIISSEPQTQAPESVEKMDDSETIEPQNISQKSIMSPTEESVAEEIAQEDIVTFEPDECHHQPQDPEIVELDTTETNKSQEITSSGIVSDYEESTLEDNVTVTEPNPEAQAESLRSAEVMEDTENVKNPGALAGEAAQEENVETKAIVDISPVQESELEEGKNTEHVGTEKNITPSDLPSERMENETITYDSSVASIREVTENDIITAITPPADIQPVLKQESVEDKCNDTTEKPRETQQVISSASDKHIPTQDNKAMAEPASETPLNNVVTQGIKESEDEKTDQFSILGSFPTPAEVTEESKLPRIETISLTEEMRGIEAVENEDHQQHTVSTLEPAVDNKTSVEDYQVHDERTAELKDNETLETEQIFEPRNISTLDNAPEKRSELGDEAESSRESEDCKPLKEEETSDQKIVTLKDTATEDIVADSPVGMEQEHKQKSVEEVKDIIANQAQEDFCTSQPNVSDKLPSESNVAATESTYVQCVNDFETNEMKSIEGINGGDSSCEQIEIATSVDSSPKDNEIAPPEHPVESHEENLGNGTENAMLFHAIKDEIQTTVEQKDDAFSLDGTAPTAKKNSMADEDVTQSSSEYTLESSNSTDQIKEVQKAEIGETDIEGGTTESQASTENDAQASQDVTEKDNIKSDEQTNDHRQAGDIEYQPQTCESSADEKYVQKDSLDEQYKADEEFESQKEQLQADEQKHKDKSDDISNEPPVESKNPENGTANRREETDTLEAGQTEAAVNEIVKIEQALDTSKDSTASITDTTTENITGIDKGVEEENRSNSAQISNADAKMDNQEDQKNTRKDNITPVDTGAQDETDEITNEEIESSLGSSVQDISYTAPSKDYIIENDPIAVPYSAESGGHQDKECTNKVNDDLLAIQEPEKEIVAGMQQNKEMQNEAKIIHHAEPYNVDTKIDDTTHNTTGQPRDIEQIVEHKGLSSIDKPVEETSEQNNVEQHLRIHHKVEDAKLESTELEATQEKVHISNVDTANDGRMSMSTFITKHESESADDVLQLETEGNAFNKADETVSFENTEASNTSVPETVTFNEEICDKVAGADKRLSGESLKNFEDTRKSLDVSSVVTAFNEESMNEEIEEHKLAVPAHLTMDANTSEQEISMSEKPLPTKVEEQDDQIRKEQDEEDICKPDFSDDQKEVEQDLPVSNFLMNLILGKDNSDANGHSEPEEETKQEEIRGDNICLAIPKQVESLALSPTENNVEDMLAVEQEKKDVKCSEAPEVVEERSHDLKLGTETSLDTDAETNKNSHHLELPPYQDNMRGEIYNESLSEKAAEVFTKTEAKDIGISNTEQDDRDVDTPNEENTEPGVQNKNGSLVNNLDDLNNTKTSEEDTLGEGRRGLLPECSNDARSVNSESEQTLLLSESGIDAKSLSSEVDSVQNPACEIQEKANESSNIEATSILNIQVESKEAKTEDKQLATTATASAEEHAEISNDNVQKSVGPEATSDDQVSQIANQVSDTEIALSQEKENSEGSNSAVMDKKEDSDVSVKERSSIQTAVEIEADDSNMQINQDKQEAADNKTAMESEKLDESNIQEQEGNDTQKSSSKECHEEDQQFLVKKEIVIEEEDVHETVKSSTETEKIKYNDEQQSSDSKVQERDLSVFPPKEVAEPEECSVDKAMPEFSTNEKQSPKVDELNVLEEKIYEGKTKDEVKIKNFTDEAIKTEAQVAGQKASHKKQNILSGVGSKVKRQLAKVKNVITGKPGHAKPESPRS